MAVVEREDGHGFDFECEIPRCGWRSLAWPAEEMAEARGVEHIAEHEGGRLEGDEGGAAVPMTELTEFEKSVGFVRPGSEEI